MKKFFRKASLAASTFLVNATSTLAQADNDLWRETGDGLGAVRKDTLGGAITSTINYALGILGLIAVAFLIYAGVLMVTAGGDEDQIGKAKKIILWAVVGIVIVILSYTIVRFVTGIAN